MRSDTHSIAIVSSWPTPRRLALPLALLLAALVAAACKRNVPSEDASPASSAPIPAATAAPATAATAPAAPAAAAPVVAAQAAAEPVAAAPAAAVQAAAPAGDPADDAPSDGERAAPSRAAPAKGEVSRWIHRAPDDKPLAVLFAKELQDAAAEGRSVVVMFTADWCSPCKAIKEFVHESAVVQGAMGRGRLLYIDVDEWRGPAHALIPGINPTKLPTLVRVDGSGAQVVTCYGSDLGLLSEDSVASNLKRMVEGLAPERPFYADKPELERELIGKQAGAQTARTGGTAEVEATIEEADGNAARIHLILRNHDGPRRWYAIAESKGALNEHPEIAGWQQVRFGEHVRADFVRLLPKAPATGQPPVMVLPVAGYGSIDLHGLKIAGAWHKGDTLEVWELNRLGLDGQPHQFQMKLPYHLDIGHAGVQAVAGSNPAVPVELALKRKLTVVLQ